MPRNKRRAQPVARGQPEKRMKTPRAVTPRASWQTKALCRFSPSGVWTVTPAPTRNAVAPTPHPQANNEISQDILRHQPGDAVMEDTSNSHDMWPPAQASPARAVHPPTLTPLRAPGHSPQPQNLPTPHPAPAPVPDATAGNATDGAPGGSRQPSGVGGAHEPHSESR